jgi:hypothetical protein
MSLEAIYEIATVKYKILDPNSFNPDEALKKGLYLLKKEAQEFLNLERELKKVKALKFGDKRFIKYNRQLERFNSILEDFPDNSGIECLLDPKLCLFLLRGYG